MHVDRPENDVIRRHLLANSVRIGQALQQWLKNVDSSGPGLRASIESLSQIVAQYCECQSCVVRAAHQKAQQSGPAVSAAPVLTMHFLVSWLHEASGSQSMDWLLLVLKHASH